MTAQLTARAQAVIDDSDEYTAPIFRERPGALPSKCPTCDDNGMIGGPSFYNPGEGGVPCPDCAATGETS